MDRKPRTAESWHDYTVWSVLPCSDLSEPTLILVRSADVLENGREFAIRDMRRAPREGEHIRMLTYRDWADVLRFVKVMAGDEVLYDSTDTSDDANKG